MCLIGEFIGKPNNTQTKSNNNININININSISEPKKCFLPKLVCYFLEISTYTDAIESASDTSDELKGKKILRSNLEGISLYTG
jgi:hypothetical protein